MKQNLKQFAAQLQHYADRFSQLATDNCDETDSSSIHTTTSSISNGCEALTTDNWQLTTASAARPVRGREFKSLTQIRPLIY